MLQQEIFLHVIPGRIIVPLLHLKKEGSAHFCYISTGQTAFLEHLECLYIPVYIPVFMFFSRDVGSISGGEINNFNKADRCLGLVNFSFRLKFLEIQLYFSISALPSIALKR